MARLFNKTFDYPEPLDDMKALRKQIATRQYDRFEDYVSGLNVRRQQYVLSGVSSMEHDVIVSYREAMPQSLFAPMIHVDHLIHAAWHIRGNGRAKFTEQKKLITFHSAMEEITPHGLESYERYPHPLSACHMLTLCKTNTRGIESSLAVFEDAMVHYPGDYTIVDSFINYASNPKWSGIPFEAWQALSEGILAQYMPDYPLCVIAGAHYDAELVWMFDHPRDIFEERTVVLIERTLRPGVIRSACSGTGERRVIYNWMAFMHFLANDYGLARDYLARADHHVTAEPWRHCFNSARQVRRHLKWWWLNFLNPVYWFD